MSRLCSSDLPDANKPRGGTSALWSSLITADLPMPEYPETSTSSVLVLVEFSYWTRKLQAHFLAGDLASAVDASRDLDRRPRVMILDGEFDEIDFRGELVDGHLVAKGILADQEAMDSIPVGIYVLEKDATVVSATKLQSQVGDARRLWEPRKSIAGRTFFATLQEK